MCSYSVSVQVVSAYFESYTYCVLLLTPSGSSMAIISWPSLLLRTWYVLSMRSAMRTVSATAQSGSSSSVAMAMASSNTPPAMGAVGQPPYQAQGGASSVSRVQTQGQGCSESNIASQSLDSADMAPATAAFVFLQQRRCDCACGLWPSPGLLPSSYCCHMEARLRPCAISPRTRVVAQVEDIAVDAILFAGHQGRLHRSRRLAREEVQPNVRHLTAVRRAQPSLAHVRNPYEKAQGAHIEAKGPSRSTQARCHLQVRSKGLALLCSCPCPNLIETLRTSYVHAA